MTAEFSLDELASIAAQAWESGKQYKVWAFYGEMGVGKTTFINALCSVLQVTSTVGSPTYSIINEYNTSGNGIILHLDCYRLAGEEEAIQAGVEDALFSGNTCFVEWPERITGLLPADTLSIDLSLSSNGLRRIDIKTGLIN